MRRTLEALNLTKLHKTVIHKNTQSINGMIRRVVGHVQASLYRKLACYILLLFSKVPFDCLGWRQNPIGPRDCRAPYSGCTCKPDTSFFSPPPTLSFLLLLFCSFGCGSAAGHHSQPLTRCCTDTAVGSMLNTYTNPLFVPKLKSFR